MNVMERLKQDTHTEHMLLHKNPLMGAALNGSITKDQYVDQLTQLYYIHRRIEYFVDVYDLPHVDKESSSVLVQDLVHLITGNVKPKSKNLKPLSQTSSFTIELSNIIQSNPNSLLGAVYVLEGARAGGGQLIRGKIQQHLGLEDDGTRYLNGDKDKFKEFGERVNEYASNFDEDLQHAIVSCAKATFLNIDSIYKAILPK